MSEHCCLVVFRFDDDRIGQYRYGLPILSEKGFRASTYIISSHPSNNWSQNVNWAQIQELHDSYNWEIGSHSQTHPDLDKLSAEEVYNELKQSKIEIEANLKDVTVHTFAPPRSKYNQTVLNLVKQVYDGMVVGDGGVLNTYPWDRFQMRTKGLHSQTQLSEVASWVDNAIANNHLLIISAHGIVDAPKFYTEITPKLYSEIVELVASKGDSVKVVTSYEAAMLIPQNSGLPIASESSSIASFRTLNEVDVFIESHIKSGTEPPYHIFTPGYRAIIRSRISSLKKRSNC